MIADSESDSDDDLIWDFGKPEIPEALREQFEAMKRPKRTKIKPSVWPSRQDLKAALADAEINKPESPPQVETELVKALRAQIKQFRRRLDLIAQRDVINEDCSSSTSNFEHSTDSSPPHKKVKAKSHDCAFNDSIDDDSLSLCSQLVENRLANDNLTEQQRKSYPSKIDASIIINKTLGDKFPPTVTQPLKASNLLDEDDDVFLNESLSSF